MPRLRTLVGRCGDLRLCVGEALAPAAFTGGGTLGTLCRGCPGGAGFEPAQTAPEGA